MVVQKETRSVIAKLKRKHQQEFFNAVQERFVTASDYIRPKFPLKDVALLNAEVVELRAVDRMSFQKVLFFCGAFPSHVGPTNNSVSPECKLSILKRWNYSYRLMTCLWSH